MHSVQKPRMDSGVQVLDPVSPLQGFLFDVSVTQGGARGCRRSALPWAMLFGPFRAEC